jgi:hypothetical protein
VSSNGSSSASVTFKGVSSGGGSVSYKASPPPAAQTKSCTGFCVLFH